MEELERVIRRYRRLVDGVRAQGFVSEADRGRRSDLRSQFVSGDMHLRETTDDLSPTYADTMTTLRALRQTLKTLDADFNQVRVTNDALLAEAKRTSRATTHTLAQGLVELDASHQVRYLHLVGRVWVHPVSRCCVCVVPLSSTDGTRRVGAAGNRRRASSVHCRDNRRRSKRCCERP